MNAPNDSMEGLFAPLPLGRQTAPNRFVFAAHQTNFATHNRFTERHAARVLPDVAWDPKNERLRA